MSAGMNTRSAGIGSERGVMTWDAVGVFNFVVSAEAEGESGDGMGCRTCIL